MEKSMENDMGSWLIQKGLVLRIIRDPYLRGL